MYNKNISGISSSSEANYLDNQEYLKLVEENLFDSVVSMSDFYRHGIKVRPFVKNFQKIDSQEIEISKVMLNGGYLLPFIRKMKDNYFLQIKDGKVVLSAYVLDVNNKQKFLNFLTNRYLMMKDPLSREQLPISFYPGNHIIDKAGIIYDINLFYLSEIDPISLSKKGIEILRINLLHNLPTILLPLKLINMFGKIINEKLINYASIFASKNSEYFDSYLSIAKKVNCPVEIKKIIANSFFLRDNQKQPFLIAEVTRNIMKEIMVSEWKDYFLTPLIYDNQLLKENPGYLIPKPNDFSILLLLIRDWPKVVIKQSNYFAINPEQILDKLKDQKQISFNKEQIRRYFIDLKDDEFDFVYQEFLKIYSQKKSLGSDISEIIILEQETIIVGDKLFSFIINNFKKINRDIIEYILKEWIEKIIALKIIPEMLADNCFNRYVNLLVINNNPYFFSFLHEVKLFFEKNSKNFQSESTFYLLDILNSWYNPIAILEINRSDLYSRALHSTQVGFFYRLLFQIKNWLSKYSQNSTTLNTSIDLSFKEEDSIKIINNMKDKKLQILGLDIDSLGALQNKLDSLWQDLELPSIEIINRSSLDLSIKDIVRRQNLSIDFDKNIFRQMATNYLNKISAQAFGLKNNKILEEYIFLKMVDIYIRGF